jgi:hypothetical protein
MDAHVGIPKEARSDVRLCPLFVKTMFVDRKTKGAQFTSSSSLIDSESWDNGVASALAMVKQNISLHLKTKWLCSRDGVRLPN